MLPSYDEGFPIVLLEAMSIGLPVVASHVAGIPELVTDGETGFLIAPGDTEALATRVVVLLGDSDLRSRLGRLGKQRVDKMFNRSRMLEALRSVYSDILKQ